MFHKGKYNLWIFFFLLRNYKYYSNTVGLTRILRQYKYIPFTLLVTIIVRLAESGGCCCSERPQRGSM